MVLRAQGRGPREPLLGVPADHHSWGARPPSLFPSCPRSHIRPPFPSLVPLPSLFRIGEFRISCLLLSQAQCPGPSRKKNWKGGRAGRRDGGREGWIRFGKGQLRKEGIEGWRE
jgi:hypothetical protein